MSTVAQAARVARPHRGESKAAHARGLGGGVLWIVVFAVLLAGVVAVNVAVLRLNLQLDRVSNERTQLKADINDLSAQISTRATTSQIEKTARDELGLVQADPDQTTFVRLPAK
jgi:cell division protein FtsL